MSKNMVKQLHFRERAASYSTRGARTGVSLLGWETPENMTPEEERQAILARIRNIETFLRDTPLTKSERAPFGQEIHKLHQAMRAIRPGMQNLAPRGLNRFICDVVKNDVTRFQWERYIREAQRLMSLEIERERADSEREQS